MPDRPSGSWRACRLRSDLIKGSSLPGGGTLRVEVDHVGTPLPQGLDPVSR